jgi:hypothetical protein
MVARLHAAGLLAGRVHNLEEEKKTAAASVCR